MEKCSMHSKQKKFNGSHFGVVVFFILVVAFICLVISYSLASCNGWFSDLFMSIAGGIIGGLVIYCLSNLRSGKFTRTSRELLLLQEIAYKAHELEMDLKYYLANQYLYDEENTREDFFEKSIEKGSDIWEKVYALDDKLIAETNLDPEEINPFYDCSDLETRYRKLTDIDDEPGLSKFNDIVEEYANRMEKLGKMLKMPITIREKSIKKIEKSML